MKIPKVKHTNDKNHLLLYNIIINTYWELHNFTKENIPYIVVYHINLGPVKICSNIPCEEIGFIVNIRILIKKYSIKMEK
jgi:hypothetical protein